MKFIEIESLESARAVFPVMKELRTHLDEAAYLELFQAAKTTGGYRLIGAFEQEKCIGLMGYRVLLDFVHGKHLYIDDLVVAESYRSRGLGARLLTRAKEIANAENCSGLRLCTGIQNEAGKRFYEAQGWQQRAVAFKLSL